MRSIERSLLAWILGALGLGAVLVAVVTYVVILDEMNEVFDENLEDVAQAVEIYHYLEQHRGGGALNAPLVHLRPLEDDDIVTTAWTLRGEQIHASDPAVHLPFTKVEGLTRPKVDGVRWIVYSSVSELGVVQAAQRFRARQELARNSALKILPPLTGLIALVAGLLIFGLRKGLQSLDMAAVDIASRSDRSLKAIELGDIPREISPIVASINGLMARLSLAFTAQRRFLADAAHELRTPMTALRLQLQLLERAQDDGERRRGMAELASGIDRSQRLIEQLLQVARSEPDGKPDRFEPVDLADLVRSVVSVFSVKAEHVGLDLGASVPSSPLRVHADPNQLTVLLNNLVENAFRYTPAGGVVDVEASLVAGQPTLTVTDTGPGIPEADRERVFDRFYRCEDAQSQARDGSGSGLGLAIVKSIADRHQARVVLATAPSGQGLQARVIFPQG